MQLSIAGGRAIGSSIRTASELAEMRINGGWTNAAKAAIGRLEEIAQAHGFTKVHVPKDASEGVQLLFSGNANLTSYAESVTRVGRGVINQITEAITQIIA